MASSGYDLRLEALRLVPMASGRKALNLTEQVDWAQFPEYARALIGHLGGQLIDVTESVEMRIWCISIDGIEVRLVYEDYPQLVSMESLGPDGDHVLARAAARLAAHSA